MFFAVDGFIFASWAVRIPAVKASVGASPAALGVALLGVSGGAIATMALSGALCRRFGSNTMIAAGAVWLSLAVLLPPLARSAVMLGLALVVFGIGYGCLNVAMNALAIDLVAAIRRPVMPSFHAAWSFGGLAGAGLGGLLAPFLAPFPHLALAGAAGLAVAAVCGRTLFTDEARAVAAGAVPAGAAGAVPAATVAAGGGAAESGDGAAELGAGAAEAGAGAAEPQRGGRGHVWRVVVFSGLIALCGAYGEGAVGDWGALHLREDLGAGAGLAAAGYAAFALAEACGRLGGTRLLGWLGQTRVIMFGGFAACAGMLLAGLVPVIGLALAGFALAGLGVANLFPAAMMRAGTLAGPTGVALASTLGYAGFLLGPPAIGFLASHVSLGTGLTTVSFLALVAAAIGYVSRGHA
jgi:hypothetical protein